MTKSLFSYGHILWKLLHNMFERPRNDGDAPTATIQEVAFKLVEEQLRQLQLDGSNNSSGNAGGGKERTIFVLGSKGVGKSTVLNKFFDREENTRPTLALEYSYGRRSAASIMPVQHQHQQQFDQKHILNVWELGSLENAKQLIEVPLRTHGVENMAAIIMLDLSQPQRLWMDLSSAVRGLRQACDRLLTAEGWHRCRCRLMERLKKDEDVEENIEELLPFPVVLVGGKYDIFMDYDPALKRHICQCLRSVAHLIGGAVLFYGYQLPKLVKTLRDTISHLGFNSPTNPFRLHTTDHNEALSIWFGTDSWQLIGGKHIQYSGGDGTSILDRIGVQLAVEVPQLQVTQDTNSVILETKDPSRDPAYGEVVIDSMRSQMNEEIQVIMRESQLRGQFESVPE